MSENAPSVWRWTSTVDAELVDQVSFSAFSFETMAKALAGRSPSFTLPNQRSEHLQVTLAVSRKAAKTESEKLVRGALAEIDVMVGSVNCIHAGPSQPEAQELEKMPTVTVKPKPSEKIPPFIHV